MPFWAGMYGDLLALHVGTGGGGMSVKFSGDTEASSEPSVDAAGNGSMLESPCCLEVLSSTSLRTCDTIAGLGPGFLRCGFEIGELLTLGLDLVLAALFFLAFFDSSLFDATGG